MYLLLTLVWFDKLHTTKALWKVFLASIHSLVLCFSELFCTCQKPCLHWFKNLYLLPCSVWVNYLTWKNFLLSNTNSISFLVMLNYSFVRVSVLIYFNSSTNIFAAKINWSWIDKYFHKHRSAFVFAFFFLVHIIQTQKVTLDRVNRQVGFKPLNIGTLIFHICKKFQQ